MRISDWSSDVCSSDLRRHCFCGRARGLFDQRQRDEFHRWDEDIQHPPADPPVERPWQFERRNRKPWRQRMIAIVETATGTVEAIVESLDGVDMAGRHSIALPEGYDPIAGRHVLVDGRSEEHTDELHAPMR